MTAPRAADAFDALMRQSLPAFVAKTFHHINPGATYQPNWHVEAMTHQLERVARGDLRRSLISVPPRHLKSVCAAVAFPAWMLGRDPALRFLVASYGADLAAKHARDFRAVVQSPWYRQAFPRFGDLKRTSEADIVTSHNGGRKAVSLGGAVTGFGADILIIDDLMKAADAGSAAERQRVKEFYEQTLFSRLDDKQTGRIVALGQRLHEDDFAGYLLEKGNFAELCLRAIAEQDETFELGGGRTHTRRRGEALFPAREPRETLDQVIRVEIGNAAFAAQYQQNPVALDNAHIRWERIHTYDQPLPRERYLQVHQSWDTAMKAGPSCDFSVCTTWGFADGAWWLLDLIRVRLDYPELRARALSEAAKWRPTLVLIEEAGTGIPLLSDLVAEVRRRPRRAPGPSWMPRAYHPRVDKLTRLAAQAAKLEDGRVRLPRAAPWLPELKRELLGFPQTKYDDQVDSISQFLDHFGNYTPRLGRPR
jgi:predicted phage terminase large subunit-like protein